MSCSHTSSSTSFTSARLIQQRALLRSRAHRKISFCPCFVVWSLLLLFLLITSSASVAQGDGSSEGSGSNNINDMHPSAASSATEQLDGQLALNFRGKHELITTFDGTAGLAGIMFGVLNTSPSQYASITHLILHTSAEDEVPVQIYSKSGSHMDFDMDPHAWTIAAETVVEGQGQGQMTPIPDGAIRNGSLLLPPGETMALYVTLTAESSIEGETPPALLCTNGTWLGAIAAQSYFDGSDGSSVILFEGAAVSYPLSDNIYAPCMFNGAVEYDILDLVEDANISEKAPSQSAESTQSTTTQPVSSGEEENSKEVTAPLVLKLQTLTSTMDNDALLVLQAACQSFLGELFRYTQPLVREVQCQVMGQMTINDPRRRRELDGSTKIAREHEAGGIRRTVGEGGEANPALQVELLVKGNVNMAVPITYEKIGFEETASDFFAIVSGRFIALLREVSEGAGVSYFDTVYAVSVMQQSTPKYKAPPTKGNNNTETAENRGDWESSSGGVSINSNEMLPLGLMIFLLIVIINVLGILAVMCLIQHRRASGNNTKWRFTNCIKSKSTPRGVGGDVSVTSPPTQPQHTPSGPPMSPHDFEDGDSVNNKNDNRNCSDTFKKEDDATDATCPPLSEVACSNTDDSTFTSHLHDFESVAGGAAKERVRERAAAAILGRITVGRRHSTASSTRHSATATGKGGGGAAIAVDEYIGDDISSNQISLVPGRGTPEEDAKGSGGIDSRVDSNSWLQVSTFSGRGSILAGQEEGVLSVNQKSVDGNKGTPRSSSPSKYASLSTLISGVSPSLTVMLPAKTVCLPSPTSAMGEDGAGDNKKNNNNEEESAKKDLSKPGLLSGIPLTLSFIKKMMPPTDDNPAAAVSSPLPKSSPLTTSIPRPVTPSANPSPISLIPSASNLPPSSPPTEAKEGDTIPLPEREKAEKVLPLSWSIKSFIPERNRDKKGEVAGRVTAARKGSGSGGAPPEGNCDEGVSAITSGSDWPHSKIMNEMGQETLM